MADTRKKRVIRRDPLRLVHNIHRLCYEMEPNRHMTDDARVTMNGMINGAIRKLITTADAMARSGKKNTITLRIIKAAIKSITGGSDFSFPEVDKISAMKDVDKIQEYNKVFVKHHKHKEVAVKGIRLGRAASIMRALTCMSSTVDAKATVVCLFDALVGDLLQGAIRQCAKPTTRVDARHLQAVVWSGDFDYMKDLYTGEFDTGKSILSAKEPVDGTLKLRRKVSKPKRRVGAGKGALGKKMAKGMAFEEFSEGESEGFDESDDDDMMSI
jgi:histone H3/H4